MSYFIYYFEVLTFVLLLFLTQNFYHPLLKWYSVIIVGTISIDESVSYSGFADKKCPVDKVYFIITASEFILNITPNSHLFAPELNCSRVKCTVVVEKLYLVV